MKYLTPVQPDRIYKEVVNRLLRMIREGHLRPGDFLPSERELAAQLGVSRVSVRDAIRFLEARGVVQVRQGEGTRVRALDAAALARPLETLLELRRELVRHLFDLRRMIEPEFAAEAARRITPNGVAELREILKRQAERTERGEFPIEEDDAFHRGIVQATGNPMALEVYALVAEYLRSGRDLALKSRERAYRSLEGHRAILGAISQGDSEGARAAMRRHLDEVEALLFGSGGQSPGNTVGGEAG